MTLLRHRSLAAVGVMVAVAVSLLLVLVASVILVAQSDSRSRIQTNFNSRGTTAAEFATDFVQGVADRQSTVAVRVLAGRTIDQQRLDDLDVALGFTASAVLDSTGRVLATSPAGSSNVSQALGLRDAYLRVSDAGGLGVSDVVSDAPDGNALVAVATPFVAAGGQRVFVGAFPVADGTLGQYLAHVIVSPLHHVYIVDAKGRIIASNPQLVGTLAGTDPALDGAIGSSGSGTYSRGGVATAYAVSAVAGTPWRLILSEPSSVLFATTRGFSGLAPWVVFFAVTGLSALLGLLLVRGSRDRRALAAFSASMAVAAETDELTGLANRRRLVGALEAARSQSSDVSVVMVDLDKFKEINDTYGHDVGDRVLIAVAEAMRTVFREQDVFGRWGGDEFLALLQETSLEEAFGVAERLRAALASTVVSTSDARTAIAVSVGVASGPPELDDLLRRADLALYSAKAAGGGTVVEERSAS